MRSQVRDCQKVLMLKFPYHYRIFECENLRIFKKKVNKTHQEVQER